MMDIRTFIDTVKLLPVDQAVLVRGNHGIGKSQLVAQLGEYFKLKVIDIRLSQREAGDVIGLPKLDDGVTRFCPPEWVRDCCENPRVLFLDELNRATPEVQQAMFELVLDRRMAGNTLHPETRVYSAINLASTYQVNEMDVALLDRFFVVDLEPTLEETLAHYKNIGVNESIISYLREKSSRLDPSPKVDPSKRQPSRRSWDRFDSSVRKAGLYDIDLTEDKAAQGRVYSMAAGYLGVEIASNFTSFLVSNSTTIKVDDLLNSSWKKVEPRVKKASIDQLNDLIDRVITHGTSTVWTPTQVNNIGDFAESLPAELRVSFVLGIMQPSFNRTEQGSANIKSCKRVAMAVVEAFNSKQIDEEKIKSFAEARAAKAKQAEADAQTKLPETTASNSDSKLLSPEDCYFSIGTNQHNETLVALTSIDHFEKEQTVDDNLTRNMIAANSIPDHFSFYANGYMELNDGVEMTLEQARTAMLSAGFVESKELGQVAF